MWLVRVIAVTLAVCFAAGVVAAAPLRRVRGVVVEAGTSTPIAAASVLSERGEIAVTDTDGYFMLDVPAGDRELTVAANGYATKQVTIVDDVIHIQLAAASGAEVIEVTGRAPEETKPLAYQLTADEIRFIPGAGNDILRAVQALPGVARIPYAFGGLVLRGASPRDTSVFLDGIEVPIAFHFGGVTSFYPSGMLADLTLTAGGFDASYGRAQGGVVALTTREPRKDRWRTGGSIGLLDSSVQVEGPLPRDGGIIMGLRRSYFDTIAAPFVPDHTPLPSYWDYQVRTSWGDPHTQGRISPMIFGSIDRVASDEVAVTSMFLRLAAPFHRQWGKTTLHVVPWLGWNQLTFEDKSEPDRPQTFSRPTFPGGIRAELLHDYPWGHLRGGAEISGGYVAQTQVGFTGDDGPTSSTGSSTILWSDPALWAEARWKIDGERLAVKPGVRMELYGLTDAPRTCPVVTCSSSYLASGRPEIVVDPRLNIHQQLTDKLTLRQAIGRYHQPPIPGDVDPVDGNPGLGSSHVDQISLGVDTKLPRDVLTSVTGFFAYGDQLALQVRNPRPGSDVPEPNLGGLGPTFQLLLEKQLGFAIYRDNIGRSRTYGAELLVKRNVGAWFTMLAYTLSRSDRTDVLPLPSTTGVPPSRRGWRPFELDQRHNLNVAVSRMFSSWRLGARLQIVSGNPYSPTTRRADIFDAPPVSVPWAARLPTFFSLDLRADRRWHRCWGDINFYVDIQNATNHHNVEGRDYDYDQNRDVDVPGLPIVPFIGVEFLPLL